MFSIYNRNEKTNLPLRYLRKLCRDKKDKKLTLFLNDYELYDNNNAIILPNNKLCYETPEQRAVYICNEIIEKHLIPHNKNRDEKYKVDFLFLHYDELRTVLINKSDEGIIADKIIDKNFLKKVHCLCISEIDLLQEENNNLILSEISSILKIRYYNTKSTVLTIYEKSFLNNYKLFKKYAILD